MKPYQRGLTLMELLVTIAIIGVLIGIGIPSFRNWILDAELTRASNDLVTAVQLARTEAIKRRAPVTVCVATLAAPGTCIATPAYGSAFVWTVFVDSDRNLVADTLPVMRTLDAPPEGIRATILPDAGSANTPYFAIGETGRSVAAANGATAMSTVVLCDSRGVAEWIGTSAARAVLMSPTGRPAVVRDSDAISARLGSLDCKP